jgi:hypothetical protein
VDLDWFLNPGGRSSIETIRSLKDFHAFGTKLATFVSRFGVDVQQLKKVLMGLTLPHVKTASGTLAVEQPFTMQYGMDPTKVLLGIDSFSRGSSWSVMRGEVTAALSQLKVPQAPVSSMLPEIHHVMRATENIALFSGNARASKEESDPVFLLTSMLFPNAAAAANKKAAPSHYFCVTGFVQSTQELSEDEARARPGEEITPSSAPAVSVTVGEEARETQNAAPTEEAPEPVASAEEVPQDAAPSGLIEDVDLNRILSSDPTIVGDAPKHADSMAPSPKRAAVPAPEAETFSEPGLRLVSPSGQGEGASPAGGEEQVSKSELDRLKEVCSAMGNDIRRLMRERREPTTDKELREAKAELEGKLKKLTEERVQLLEQMSEREKQIEVLKAQVETLRRSAA